MAVVVSCVILPGCSNEENVYGDDSSGTLFVPGDSEVEILLSLSNQSGIAIDKRAAIDGDGDFENMGVFCLARQKQDINASPEDINWFSTDEASATACIMNNVQARKTGGDVTWMDADKHYYYPISQFYSYDFYGYYPYVTGNDITAMDNRVEVTYELDGTKDIIWGRATSNEQYAYSATYFRQSGNKGRYPTLDLKHVMTRFKFQVAPGAEVEGGDEVSPAMKDYAVSKVMIVNAAAKAVLTVADFNQMTALDETNCLTGSGYTSYVLCDEEGTPIEPVMVGMDMNTMTSLGESILAIPQSEYIVRVTLVNMSTGDEFVTEHPLKLINSSTFQPGHTYTVTITAHEPKEVQLQANLNAWVDAEDNPSVNL